MIDQHSEGWCIGVMIDQHSEGWCIGVMIDQHSEGWCIGVMIDQHSEGWCIGVMIDQHSEGVVYWCNLMIDQRDPRLWGRQAMKTKLPSTNRLFDFRGKSNRSHNITQ